MKKKVVITVSMLALLSACVTWAYFSKCTLEGAALAEVCACGYCPVTLEDGKIILAAPNHSNDVGHVNGAYDPSGTNAVVFLSRGRQFPIATTWDHLGLRYVEPHDRSDYLIIRDNWKLRIRGGLRSLTR